MKLKNGLMAWAMALASVLMVAVPTLADAKRLGGGRPAGMQRQMPSKPANATPNQAPANSNAAAPAQAATPPAAAHKRNWMGPIAGLAAGLGLGAAVHVLQDQDRSFARCTARSGRGEMAGKNAVLRHARVVEEAVGRLRRSPVATGRWNWLARCG